MPCTFVFDGPHEQRITATFPRGFADLLNSATCVEMLRPGADSSTCTLRFRDVDGRQRQRNCKMYMTNAPAELSVASILQGLRPFEEEEEDTGAPLEPLAAAAPKARASGNAGRKKRTAKRSAPSAAPAAGDDATLVWEDVGQLPQPESRLSYEEACNILKRIMREKSRQMETVESDATRLSSPATGMQMKDVINAFKNSCDAAARCTPGFILLAVRRLVSENQATMWLTMQKNGQSVKAVNWLFF
jgi:hypothetical protein